MCIVMIIRIHMLVSNKFIVYTSTVKMNIIPFSLYILVRIGLKPAVLFTHSIIPHSSFSGITAYVRIWSSLRRDSASFLRLCEKHRNEKNRIQIHVISNCSLPKKSADGSL